MSIYSVLNNQLRNILRKVVYTTYASLCRNKLKEPQKILFLLSHPRAGTTLTVNLLCTNPEIIGVGEMKVRYHSNHDLNMLKGRVYSKHRKMTITEKFLLDNINVSWFLPNPNILDNKNIFCLFLIRDGESTISSLLNPNFPLNKAFPGSKIEDKLTFTYKYYQRRLHDLEKYAKIINDKERAMYISYEQLLYDTQKVFKSLKKFLKTEFFFSESYSPIPIEGVQNLIGSVAGDIYSEKIMLGKIIRQPSKLISLPSEIVEGCQESYSNAQMNLQKYCRCVDDYV